VLIGELSRRAGVHPHQLRYYEAQGLLRPGRGTNGYREYSEGDVTTVTQIRKLLAAGLSTVDIEYLLPCATGEAPNLEPCPELLDALNERLSHLDEQIATLSRTRRALKDYIEVTARTESPDYPPCDAEVPEPAPQPA
jgi:DNA-binding transcriptional MerR regulator